MISRSKKLLIIYNDINKSNHKEIDGQTFTVQKPKECYNEKPVKQRSAILKND